MRIVHIRLVCVRNVFQQRGQEGATGDESFLAAAATDDGGVVVAGYSNGTIDGVVSEGSSDFLAVKLDADGVEEWRWQVKIREGGGGRRDSDRGRDAERERDRKTYRQTGRETETGGETETETEE